MDTHKKISEILAGFALGELSEQAQGEVKSHLAQCPQCTSELKRLEALLECTGRISELSADEQTCESAKQTILAAVKNQEKESTAGPNTGPAFIWRIIMNNKLTKLAAAAVITIVAVFVINQLGGSVDGTSTAYGITEALNLYKNADTVHIHGWFYLPTKNKEKQELIKVPFEHWFDLENGCYKIIKPGGIDEDSGERKYFTTISDGQYIMNDFYRIPLDGEPQKVIRFKRLTEFQALLQTHNSSYNFIMQMFGGVDTVNGFVKMGNETIDGVSCDIWEGAITTPGPKGDRKVKIKSWLSPDTGKLCKVQTWSKLPDSSDWTPLFEIDRIELNLEPPAGIFRTDPPEGVVLENTKENAPFAELGAGHGMSIESLMLHIHIGFTLSDGSVIICWRGIDKSHPVQDELFNDLKMGGTLPKLPLEIEGLEPLSDIDVKYNGYHLAHTKKDDKIYEWSIYVPEMQVPPRSSIIGYKVLHRYNVDAKDKIIGSISTSLHEDIQIDTEEDFDTWVLGAMKELGDNNEVPDEITYEKVLLLTEQIRQSLIE